MAGNGSRARGRTIAAYNEAFDDTGALRAPYRAFQTRTGSDPFQPSLQSTVRLTRRPLGDGFTILPLPLVLDDREYRETIAPGVRQRALALQSLFHDWMRGESRVFRETRLPPDLLPRVLQQESRDRVRSWEGKSREDVRFLYAPDLVRAPDGRWRVLEDNLGCVGGVADSYFALEAFLAHTGATLHPSVPRGSDLARAVRGFLERVGRKPESLDVLALLGHEGPNADSEAGRKRRVLRDIGMRVLNVRELEEEKRRGLRSRDVGAVVNFDTRGWIPESELIEMFDERSVPLLMAPGVEVLGNKAFLPFLDDVVSYYSGEEPILRAAATELCRALPGDPSGWVLKRSNGCRGQEVFFLDEMSDGERSQLEASLAKWGEPERAVLQRRVSASFLPVSPGAAWHRFQVELRPLVFVLGDSTALVGEHPSARASSNLDGRGLGNMSQGAHYLSVIREPPAPSDRSTHASIGGPS